MFLQPYFGGECAAARSWPPRTEYRFYVLSIGRPLAIGLGLKIYVRWFFF
jgi:hypothetical protein